MKQIVYLISPGAQEPERAEVTGSTPDGLYVTAGGAEPFWVPAGERPGKRERFAVSGERNAWDCLAAAANRRVSKATDALAEAELARHELSTVRMRREGKL